MSLWKRAAKWGLTLLTLGVLLLLLILLIRFPRRGSQKPPLLEMTVIPRAEGSSPGVYLRQGMEQAAADLNVELRFLLPASPGDGEEQRQLLHWEVENGAAAILLFPADRGALAEEVKSAGSAVLVTLETDMTGEGAGGYIGVDNAALGREVARAALNGTRKGETVLLVHSVPGDNGIAERLLSAEALLLSEGRLPRRLDLGKGAPSDALLEGLEQDGTAKAVLVFESAALEQVSDWLAPLETPPLLYGAGSTAGVVAGLERGSITAAVAQNDFSVGYLAVEQAACLARRKTPAERGELTFFTVRKENLYDPEYQKLLFPVTR